MDCLPALIAYELLHPLRYAVTPLYVFDLHRRDWRSSHLCTSYHLQPPHPLRILHKHGWTAATTSVPEVLSAHIPRSQNRQNRVSHNAHRPHAWGSQNLICILPSDPSALPQQLKRERRPLGHQHLTIDYSFYSFHTTPSSCATKNTEDRLASLQRTPLSA